jgi:O-antigen/teichoic acid export membrane protein
LFGCFLFVGLFMFYYFVTGAQLVATGRHKVTVKANMV